MCLSLLIRGENSLEKRGAYQLTNCIVVHYYRFLIDQAESLHSHNYVAYLNDLPIVLNHKDKKKAQFA